MGAGPVPGGGSWHTGSDGVKDRSSLPQPWGDVLLGDDVPVLPQDRPEPPAPLPTPLSIGTGPVHRGSRALAFETGSARPPCNGDVSRWSCSPLQSCSSSLAAGSPRSQVLCMGAGEGPGLGSGRPHVGKLRGTRRTVLLSCLMP